MPANLRCFECGRRYEAGTNEPWRCACGHALDFEWDPVPDLPPDPPELDRNRGLWAFADVLPVDATVTLGEGFTPLVDVPDWDAAFKLEYVFPSGSFKDRGATTTLSRAVELGVDRVVEDSSGNAGAAIAQYAARAGIDARIFVPADAKPAKLAAIERVGATVERVEGDRAAVTDACIDAVESGAGWYASHAWNPAFFAGTATFAFEVCAQRGWSAPDAVVAPVGHGTLYLGAYRGFEWLARAGWIESVPRMLGIQAAGVAPIATARRGDADGSAGGDRNDVADGVQIESPARRDQILSAAEECDGDVIAVGSDETERALARLRKTGFDVEPTSALAPAGLDVYRDRGVLAADDEVIVPLTGSGLKS